MSTETNETKTARTTKTNLTVVGPSDTPEGLLPRDYPSTGARRPTPVTGISIIKEERTLPLTVRNTGFLLDRLGEDCAPLQFLRELTQNAIEAIRRVRSTPPPDIGAGHPPSTTGGIAEGTTSHPAGRYGASVGQILWDVDWLEYELSDTPTYKLSVTDNGDGMTGEEMAQHINQLSSSLAQQSVDGNYGVGAKIAAATRNHAGLIYLSWKHGKGSMIHLWRDPGTGQYGLRQLKRPDGTFGHWAEVADEIKPDIIKDHGTKVVLFGHSAGANTMAAPPGSSTPSRWIAKYLNTRYFSLPEDIIIKAREGWEYPRSDNKRNIMRRVTGQRDYLDAHSSSRGTVALGAPRATGESHVQATAHWWILKDMNALTNSFVEASGHVAALHGSELYEMVTGRAGRARVQSFGVLLGHNRVVIYVEPSAVGARKVTTNTARTQLLIDSQPLPWEEWAEEFRRHMPAEIVQLMEEVAAGSDSSDNSDSIRERLKSILDLFRVSRYRPSPVGEVRVMNTEPTQGVPPPSIEQEERERDDDSEPTAPVKDRAPKKIGSAGGIYAAFLKDDGTPSDQINPDVFPETRWVSACTKTRVVGDMEDRAARYLADQNVLLINEDFRVFTDMVEKWHQEFGGQPGIRETIKKAVHIWFEQALVETVIGVQALKGAKEWSSKQVEEALSEESLTASVMPRYHIHNAVKRELATKLGRLGVVS